MADGPLPEHYEPFESPVAVNLMSPNNRSHPIRRHACSRATWRHSASRRTSRTRRRTYRLTEHFHYWTKHSDLNAITQPQQFVEIGEELAKEKGIKDGDMVKVRSNRGEIKTVACVTKRIKALDCERHEGAHVGIPIHWGFTGVAKNGLPRQHADAVRGRREHADAGVQGVHRQHRQSVAGPPCHHCNRSISSNAPPRLRRRRRYDADRSRQADRRLQVHRLQGLPGRVQRMERSARRRWPQRRRLRQSGGSHRRVVDGHAFHRVRGGERPAGVADPQGRMHALRRSGVSQGVPLARRNRAVLERHRRLHRGALHRLRLVHHRLPVQRPPNLEGGQQGYKCTLCSDRVGVGLEPACVKTCPTGAITFGSKEDMIEHAAERVVDLKDRGYSPPACTTRRVSVARTSCTC